MELELERGREMPGPERWLSPRSFAVLEDVKAQTVRERIKRGEIKAFRVGRWLRIPTSELDRIRAEAKPAVEVNQ